MADASDLHLFLKVSIDPTTQSPLLGFAYVDSLHRLLSLGQFHTSDSFSHLTDLLTLQPTATVTLGLDRVKIHQSTADRIKALLTSHHPSTTLREAKPADFKRGADAVDDLERLAVQVAEVHAVKDKVEAMGAAGAAVRELRLLEDAASMAAWRVRPFELAEFMRIDPNAAVALNLFPSEGDSDRHMSLYGLLNKGRTAMSSRLLTRWLRQPLTSLPLIQRRQRLLSIFIDSTTLRQTVRETHLHRLPDYQRILRLFVTGKAGLQHIIQLWQALGRIPELIAALDEYEGEGREELRAEFTSKLEEISQRFAPIDDLVAATIDMQAASTGYTYQLNAAIQPSLAQLELEKTRAWNDMEDDKKTAEADLGLEGRISIQLRGEKSQEWAMRVNRTDEKVLRHRPSYSVLSTNKDGVKFVTKKFTLAARAYAAAQAEYDREERKLVAQAVATVATYARVLEALIEVIAEVDLLAALANVCVNAPLPYVQPEVLAMEEGIIDMKQARHPCMETMDGVSFIPNDVLLQRGQSHLQIITGPNMGGQSSPLPAYPHTPSPASCALHSPLPPLHCLCVGKSTYIRMTGVVQLLAQLGMRVPCESARLSICDRILTRVGAGDAALKGLSTFMKEMTEASSILSLATRHSLIVIDELGRGTSTWDGFGLARAIAEHIATRIGAFCLISTHFHEMTDMQDTIPAVSNQHVVVSLVDSTSIVMTHQVRPGASARSFGVNVAQMANMPADVVLMAKGMAESMEQKAQRGAEQQMIGDGGEGEEGGVDDGEVLQLTDEEQAEIDEFLATQDQWRAAGEKEGMGLSKLSEGLKAKLAAFAVDLDSADQEEQQPAAA